MPKFLEDKLKAEYGQNSKIPYKVMNKMGVMRGNKETAKGARMDQKHQADMQKKSGFKGSASSYKHQRPERKLIKRTY